MSDFALAKEKAAAENKAILVDFSGSDWCGWCIRLDEEVFKKEHWKAYASSNLVQVLIDFPQDKSKQSEALQKQNQALATKYEVRGFPTILIFNPAGELLERTGYQRGGATAYVKHIKGLLRKHTKEEEK